MFPINLQKNIDQLGKQISLLENECKNMEMEKKKKNPKCQPPLVCKPSDNRMKPPPLKVAMKKTNSSKKIRKSTPPVSERLQPTGSQMSQCSKTWSENGRTMIKKSVLNIPAASEVLRSSQTTPTKTNRCARCVCCNVNMVELDRGDCEEFSKRGQVLHKEVLYQHPGGTIEVTVTQKPSNEKEITALKSGRKVVNLEPEVGEKQNCKCQTKGQKWAEILSSDPSNKRQVNSGNGVKNKVTGETRPVSQPLNLNNQKVLDTVEYYNNTKASQQRESVKVPVKLPPQSYRPKQQSEINTNKFQKEIQCSIKDPSSRNHVLGPKQLSHVNAFNFLFDQILHRPTDKSDKPPVDPVSLKDLREPQREPADENKNNLTSKTSSQNGATYNNLKKPSCENLKKEKEILSQELSARDNMIAALKKREDEYLVLISNLKSNLQKIKGNAQESADAVKEINFYKAKLLQQIKLSEALKQNHIKMQEIVERCTLENDKLKTQIKIYKLEAQKHEVLLAGKEAQINRYREEIQNFQRQISDHLTSLKSNAQEIDMEKMMEAIVQQTQLFTRLEGDSLLEKDPKDNSELQNALMHSTPHSSPASTKTSIVNSSWKLISSIHGQEPSRANSDYVVYLNDETQKKDFFDVFKERTQPKAAREGSSEELLGKKEPKPSSSFTSCLTENEDQVSSKSSRRDSLTSKESTNSGDGRPDELAKNRISLEEAQSNIDRLLKDMKLKFTKEILDTSPPSCSTEDFPDISQISSMSPVR